MLSDSCAVIERSPSACTVWLFAAWLVEMELHALLLCRTTMVYCKNQLCNYQLISCISEPSKPSRSRVISSGRLFSGYTNILALPQSCTRGQLSSTASKAVMLLVTAQSHQKLSSACLVGARTAAASPYTSATDTPPFDRSTGNIWPQ